jgi:FG-GAP repeat
MNFQRKYIISMILTLSLFGGVSAFESGIEEASLRHTAPGAGFGSSVAIVGDINFDGEMDIGVGVSSYIYEEPVRSVSESSNCYDMMGDPIACPPDCFDGFFNPIPCDSPGLCFDETGMEIMCPDDMGFKGVTTDVSCESVPYDVGAILFGQGDLFFPDFDPDDFILDEAIGVRRDYCEGNWRFAPAGDFNGDGNDDLVISTGSEVYILHTSLANLSDTIDPTMFLEHGSRYAFPRSFSSFDITYSYDITGGKDLNQDGFDDVLVAVSGGLANQNMFYIIWGSNADNVGGDVTLEGAIASDVVTAIKSTDGYITHSASIDFAGDFDGDTIEDLVVSNGNKVWIISGKTGSWPSTINVSSLVGDSATEIDITIDGYNGYNTDLVGVGDFNNDGYDDISIGTPNYATVGTDYLEAGCFYVVFGAETHDSFGLLEMDAARGFKVEAQKHCMQLGRSLASDDFNMDGIPDLIIGAPGYPGYSGSWQFGFYESQTELKGAVYILYGGTSNNSSYWASRSIDNLLLNEIESEYGFRLESDWISLPTSLETCNLGFSVDAGDLTDDGVPDIVAGSPGYWYNNGSTFAKPGGVVLFQWPLPINFENFEFALTGFHDKLDATLSWDGNNSDKYLDSLVLQVAPYSSWSSENCISVDVLGKESQVVTLNPDLGEVWWDARLVGTDINGNEHRILAGNRRGVEINPPKLIAFRETPEAAWAEVESYYCGCTNYTASINYGDLEFDLRFDRKVESNLTADQTLVFDEQSSGFSYESIELVALDDETQDGSVDWRVIIRNVTGSEQQPGNSSLLQPIDYATISLVEDSFIQDYQRFQATSCGANCLGFQLRIEKNFEEFTHGNVVFAPLDGRDGGIRQVLQGNTCLLNCLPPYVIAGTSGSGELVFESSLIDGAWPENAPISIPEQNYILGVSGNISDTISIDGPIVWRASDDSRSDMAVSLTRTAQLQVVDLDLELPVAESSSPLCLLSNGMGGYLTKVVDFNDCDRVLCSLQLPESSWEIDGLSPFTIDGFGGSSTVRLLSPDPTYAYAFNAVNGRIDHNGSEFIVSYDSLLFASLTSCRDMKSWLINNVNLKIKSDLTETVFTGRSTFDLVGGSTWVSNEAPVPLESYGEVTLGNLRYHSVLVNTGVNGRTIRPLFNDVTLQLYNSVCAVNQEQNGVSPFIRCDSVVIDDTDLPDIYFNDTASILGNGSAISLGSSLAFDSSDNHEVTLERCAILLKNSISSMVDDPTIGSCVGTLKIDGFHGQKSDSSGLDAFGVIYYLDVTKDGYELRSDQLPGGSTAELAGCTISLENLEDHGDGTVTLSLLLQSPDNVKASSNNLPE